MIKKEVLVEDTHVSGASMPVDVAHPRRFANKDKSFLQQKWCNLIYFLRMENERERTESLDAAIKNFEILSTDDALTTYFVQSFLSPFFDVKTRKFDGESFRKKMEAEKRKVVKTILRDGRLKTDAKELEAKTEELHQHVRDKINSYFEMFCDVLL